MRVEIEEPFGLAMSSRAEHEEEMRRRLHVAGIDVTKPLRLIGRSMPSGFWVFEGEPREKDHDGD